MTADRDTTLPPEIERALHNLVHDRRGTTTWNAARIIIAAALREAREGAGRLIRETERACDMPLHMIATTLDAHRKTGCADIDEIGALRSERDALAVALREAQEILAPLPQFIDRLVAQGTDNAKAIAVALNERINAALASPSSGSAGPSCRHCDAGARVQCEEHEGPHPHDPSKCVGAVFDGVAPRSPTDDDPLNLCGACWAKAMGPLGHECVPSPAPETPAPSGCIDGPKCCHDECREERYFRAGRPRAAAPAKED
jgi:hypothetical protein